MREREGVREGGRGVPGQPRVVFLVAMATLAAFFKHHPTTSCFPSFLPLSSFLLSLSSHFSSCANTATFSPESYLADWHSSQHVRASSRPSQPLNVEFKNAAREPVRHGKTRSSGRHSAVTSGEKVTPAFAPWTGSTDGLRGRERSHSFPNGTKRRRRPTDTDYQPPTRAPGGQLFTCTMHTMAK